MRIGETFRQILRTAALPLALTALLAAPARGQDHGDHGDHGHQGTVGSGHGSPALGASQEPTGGEADHGEGGEGHHAPPANPIQNFANFSYSGKDTHGGPYEPEKGDHKMPAPFSMALLNFAVLAYLIGRFAAPNFKKMVRERHDTVAKQLAESGRLRDEARAKLDEYGRKVADLDNEIARLVAGIRAEAEADKQRIVSEAEERALRMKRDAEQQIQAEIARVKAQLEREATLAAIAAAERILAEKTTDADHRTLNETFIRELGISRRAAS